VESAGVLLAAGASRRMGGANKLLLPMGGVPMVRRVALALLDGGLSPVVAVLGADAEGIRGALAGLPLGFVENERHGEGMGTSVARGVGALGVAAEAVALAVGDLPGLRGETVAGLVAAFRNSGKGILVPVYRGRRGHPVIFSLGRYRERLEALGGDQGARALLAENGDDVGEAWVDEPGVVEDVDTPEAYARVQGRG